MLGLQRGTVTLVPHNRQWSALFIDEKTQITDALGDLALDVQHVGSTAISGLDAKPILDIAVAVADLDTITHCVSLRKPSAIPTLATAITQEITSLPKERTASARTTFTW